MADQNLHFVFPSHLCSQEKCACANEKANTSDYFLHLVQPASLERLFAHSESGIVYGISPGCPVHSESSDLIFHPCYLL